MIVVIDGYNLLKQLYPNKKDILDRQKDLFVRHLALYRHKKAATITQLIVVFDAGPSTHATRTVKSEVVVMHSGTRSSADDWIIDYVGRNRGKEILVITLDRALRTTVTKLGGDWMSIFDFYTLMQSVLMDEVAASLPTITSDDIEKYDPYELDLDQAQRELPGTALDLLMEQASRQLEFKQDDLKPNVKRKSSAHTPSKTERRIATKIKKLG